MNDFFKKESTEKTSDIAPGFHTINPDTRLNTQPENIPAENEPKTEKKSIITISSLVPTVKTTNFSPTIYKTCIVITHVCLGNFAIFSLAQKTKSFGLFWMILFCIIVGIINYWAIMRSFAASIKCKDANYYQITEKFLGKKMRRILNVLILGYAFLCMMYLTSLTFPLIGRVVINLVYEKQYQSYDNFLKEKWGKGFIKYPFFLCVGFCVYIISYFKFIKLKYMGYFRLISISFCLLILLIQCKSYYNHYKSTIYNKENKSTYPNWTNIEKAFNSNMDFFKGLCILFANYTCMSIMFPIFEGFKIQEKPLKKTRISVFLGMLLISLLTIISIICSYLINPFSPDEFIFFRKNKNSGKDILMLITNLILVVCIILTIPRYYLMMKINFKLLFFKEHISDKINNIFTFIFCFGSSLISIYYDHYQNYLIYIGGFFSVFISYLFPALNFVKSSDKKMPFKYWNNLLQIFFASILCLIGIIGGISTIVDDIKN